MTIHCMHRQLSGGNYKGKCRLLYLHVCHEGNVYVYLALPYLYLCHINTLSSDPLASLLACRPSAYVPVSSIASIASFCRLTANYPGINRGRTRQPLSPHCLPAVLRTAWYHAVPARCGVPIGRGRADAWIWPLSREASCWYLAGSHA